MDDSTTPDNPLPEFEDTFQRFVDAGGFALPAIAEDWERDMRRPDYPTTTSNHTFFCVHGRLKSFCKECNP
jgi:hypothetical protein